MKRLSLAIPSKGRLKDKSEAWLADAGFKLVQKGGGRGYSAELKGLPDIDVMLLSAREIAEGLISGELHMGITGEDLIQDMSAEADRDVYCFRRLGFGAASVIVAVPAAWLDVETINDLEVAAAASRQRHGRQMRVATKYMNLTRRFFAERAFGEYRLIESAGATEAAPMAGSAEVIVDITSTGATLKANQLKILKDGTLLSSQAALFGSRRADWSDLAHDRLKYLLSGIEAAAAGHQLRKLSASCPIPDTLVNELALRHAKHSTAFCDKDKASDVARILALRLDCAVTVQAVDQVFLPDQSAYQRFIKSLF